MATDNSTPPNPSPPGSQGLETERPFFIVFSKRTPENITTVINEYYDEVLKTHDVPCDFNLIVPDKFMGEVTERTVVVIDPLVYEALKRDEESIDNFRIQRFQLRKHFYPNKQNGDTHNFYIKVPKNLSLTKCQGHLMERMTALLRMGIWTKDDYKIHFNDMDRMADKHSGTAYIYFNHLPDNKLEDVVLSRVFINNTKWPETGQEVRCIWARKKTESPAVEKKEDGFKIVGNKSNNVWEDKKGKHV